MALTIIGRGEVGRVFARCAHAAREETRVLTRRDDPRTDVLEEGPIVVAVREESLLALLKPLETHLSRCVFVQNGWVDQYLPAFGTVSRGLLWFTAKGELFKVLAPSIFFGPYAEQTARILEAGKVAARVELDPWVFVREIAFKLAWNNVVGLPLAVRGLSLAEYLQKHAEEARALVEETCAAIAVATQAPIDARLAFEVLLYTTRELGELRGGTKALDFRNGAVVALAQSQGRAAPVSSRLLASAKQVRAS